MRLVGWVRSLLSGRPVKQFETFLLACLAPAGKLIYRVVPQIAKRINRLHIQKNQKGKYRFQISP